MPVEAMWSPRQNQRATHLDENHGGRDRTRTCDLLRVKQTFLAKLLIIEAIVLQENSLQAPKVRSWVGGWVGCLALLSASIASGQSTTPGGFSQFIKDLTRRLETKALSIVQPLGEFAVDPPVNPGIIEPMDAST